MHMYLCFHVCMFCLAIEHSGLIVVCWLLQKLLLYRYKNILLASRFWFRFRFTIVCVCFVCVYSFNELFTSIKYFKCQRSTWIVQICWHSGNVKLVHWRSLMSIMGLEFKNSKINISWFLCAFFMNVNHIIKLLVEYLYECYTLIWILLDVTHTPRHRGINI